MLLGVVKALDRDSPELALEHREAPIGVRRDRHDSLFDPDPSPAPTPHRADDYRAAAVDVAVQQAVKGDDRLVVRGRGMHEVDDQPRFFARVSPRDAPDPLLVDAL